MSSGKVFMRDVTGVAKRWHNLHGFRESSVNFQLGYALRFPAMVMGAMRSSNSSAVNSMVFASFPVALRTCSFCSGVRVIRKVSLPDMV